MNNTNLFYGKAKAFQDKRAARTAEYDFKVQALERYKGSDGYNDEVKTLRDQLEADLKALAAEYRPGFYEDLRLMREAIDKRPMKAPTSDQVNLLNVLKLKKEVTHEELTRVAEAVKDSALAISVVNEIAREHGIARNFNHLCEEMSSEQASKIVDSMKTGIEDFLANDTTRVSRMATAYHTAHFGNGEAMRTGLDPQPPTGLMKRRSFNDREAFYRDEIGLSHDTLKKFADIVDS